MKNYYVLDMEWNQSEIGIKNVKGDVLKNEIIQIGIVKVEDQQVTDQMLLNVCPAAMRYVNKRIQKLTELTYPQLKKERRFPQAYQLLSEFIGDFDEAVIFTWDSKDIDVLKENCDYWNIKINLKKFGHVDLQASVAKKYYPGDTHRKSVETVMERFMLSSVGRAHNALVDAINESQILTVAFVDAEEAIDYYDKYYFLCSGPGTIVSPYTVIEGEKEVERALNRGQICTYPIGERAKIVFPRFRHNKKRLMVWYEDGEFFSEEVYVYNHKRSLIGYVRKLEPAELEQTALWYQKSSESKKQRKHMNCAS